MGDGTSFATQEYLGDGLVDCSIDDTDPSCLSSAVRRWKRRPRLRALLYAEFDIERGPTIRHQVPDSVVSRERFQALSAAVIPKPQLFNSLIKLTFADLKLLGRPIGLEHPTRYPRSQFLFNMCFIIDTEGDDDSGASDCIWEPLVQKMADYLVEVEQECFFLSSSSQADGLAKMMHEIFTKLNEDGECELSITEQTRLCLKLCPAFRGVEPPKLDIDMVPVMVRRISPTELSRLQLDVLVQRILPRVDGVRSIGEIAKDVQIATDLVSRCVRNLLFYDCVQVVPLFLYSNTYVATEQLHHFYRNEQQIKDCLVFVRLSEDKPCPLFSDVFRLYMSLTCGVTLEKWCAANNPRDLMVDERRLIQFGMLHGFLRKLSPFPIAIDRSDDREIAILCRGQRSLEDLAIRQFAISPAMLKELLDADGGFAFVYK